MNSKLVSALVSILVGCGGHLVSAQHAMIKSPNGDGFTCDPQADKEDLVACFNKKQLHDGEAAAEREIAMQKANNAKIDAAVKVAVAEATKPVLVDCSKIVDKDDKLACLLKQNEELKKAPQSPNPLPVPKAPVAATQPNFFGLGGPGMPLMGNSNTQMRRPRFEDCGKIWAVRMNNQFDSKMAIYFDIPAGFRPCAVDMNRFTPFPVARGGRGQIRPMLAPGSSARIIPVAPTDARGMPQDEFQLPGVFEGYTVYEDGIPASKPAVHTRVKEYLFPHTELWSGDDGIVERLNEMTAKK